MLAISMPSKPSGPVKSNSMSESKGLVTGAALHDPGTPGISNAENNLWHVVWLLARRQPDSFIAEARISKSLKIAGKQFGHAVAPDLVVKVFVVSNERNVHLQMVQSDDVEVVR